MALEVQIEKKLTDFALEVSFRAEAEPLSILGASGAGKTMLLRCIAGLERPDRGRIKLNDHVFFDSESHLNIPARQRRVGMLFQNYALFPHRTVAENIGFGLEGLPQDDRSKRVAALIERTHLPGLESRYSRTLSGGEQQRVALARALAIEPEALLLDEPLISARHAFAKPDGNTASGNVCGISPAHAARHAQHGRSLPPRRKAAGFITRKSGGIGRQRKNISAATVGGGCAADGMQEYFARARHFGSQRGSPGLGLHATPCATHDAIRRSVHSPPNGFVGIRAHHIEFVEANGASSEENVFPCWLVQSSETPFRVTLFLTLQQHSSQSPQPGAAQLQAEVYKEKWQRFRDKPLPWHVRLPPDSLFWMKE